MKRRKPAAPKDPLRKEYSTLQNMVYIMKGTFLITASIHHKRTAVMMYWRKNSSFTY